MDGPSIFPRVALADLERLIAIDDRSADSTHREATDDYVALPLLRLCLRQPETRDLRVAEGRAGLAIGVVAANPAAPTVKSAFVPANDERVRDTILKGRRNMPRFNDVLDDKQINDLIAYLHTL